MIGQKKLLEQFNSFDSIFSSIVLFGPKGSGKTTLVNEIANNINCDIIEISSVINDEIKEKLYNNPNNTLVYLDLTKNLQQSRLVAIQNSALKFIEDIPVNYKLFILAENESFVLDTVLNRCHKVVLNEYTLDELKLIAKDNTELQEYPEDKFVYFRYPAEILNAPKLQTLTDIEKLIDTIFSSIGKANISNILSISKKIETDYLSLFFNIFNYKLVNKLKTEYTENYFKTFILFNSVYVNINKHDLNKKYMLEQFLLDLKNIL